MSFNLLPLLDLTPFEMPSLNVEMTLDLLPCAVNLLTYLPLEFSLGIMS